MILGLQTKLMVGVAVASLAFLTGFKYASDKAELSRLRDLESYNRHLEAVRGRGARIASGYAAKVIELESLEKVQRGKLNALITSKEDSQCAPSVDVVRVLNESRPPLSGTTGGVIEADTPAPQIGFRDLVADNLACSIQYEVARAQGNALIRWHKAVLDRE